MTYVRLAGGLGNQFFQILHAFICSKTDDSIIILTNSLKEFKTRDRLIFITLFTLIDFKSQASLRY